VSPGPGGPKEKIWCLPKPGADVEALQRNIDYVCGLEAEYCKPIQEGGECFMPNTVKAHAAFAMNAYYQGTEKNDYDCDFEQTAAISNVNPSMFIFFCTLCHHMHHTFCSAERNSLKKLYFLFNLFYLLIFRLWKLQVLITLVPACNGEGH
jgi:hypothetical protein